MKKSQTQNESDVVNLSDDEIEVTSDLPGDIEIVDVAVTAPAPAVQKKKKDATRKASKKQATKRKFEGGPLTVWGIDEQVKTDFKQACKDNGLTMKEALSSLMCEFITETYRGIQE